MRLVLSDHDDAQEHEKLHVPPPPLVSKPQDIFLPLGIILYLGNFLKFEDYRSFIQSFWPNGDESNIVRAKLWKLSTHKLEATFLNGKRLEIEYNFDPSRVKEDRVLVSLDSLLPVFGDSIPKGLNKFTSIMDLFSFVKKDVHLNKCSNYRRACCPCQLMHDGEEFYGVFVKPSVDECEYGHFHHYCWEHVVSWLEQYLKTSILLRESTELFNEDIAEQYSYFPEDIRYFQTGNRATPEFLLRNALEIDVAIYECDDEYKFTTVEVVEADDQRRIQSTPE